MLSRAAFLLLLFASVQDEVPVDADAGLAPEVRAALAMVDSMEAGWEGEARAEEAKHLLKKLGHLLGDPQPEHAARDLPLTEHFRCTDLYP